MSAAIGEAGAEHRLARTGRRPPPTREFTLEVLRVRSETEDVDLPVVDLAERVHAGLDVVPIRQGSGLERQARVAGLGERLPGPRRRRGVVEPVDRRDEARHEKRCGDRSGDLDEDRDGPCGASNRGASREPTEQTTGRDAGGEALRHAAAERRPVAIAQRLSEWAPGDPSGSSCRNQPSTDERTDRARCHDPPVDCEVGRDADELLEHHPGDEVADEHAERQTDGERHGSDRDGDPPQATAQRPSAATEGSHHRDLTGALGDQRVRGRREQHQRDQPGDDAQHADERAHLLDVGVDRCRAVGQVDGEFGERVPSLGEDVTRGIRDRPEFVGPVVDGGDHESSGPACASDHRVEIGVGDG